MILPTGKSHFKSGGKGKFTLSQVVHLKRTKAILPPSMSPNTPRIFKYIVFPGEFTDSGGLIFHLFLGRVNHVPKAKPLSKGEQTASKGYSGE